eukprot:8197536-Heterocapsa_arctica.AAC.1
MGSYARQHKKGLAGPPIPNPLRMALATPSTPAMPTRTSLPWTRERRAVWSQGLSMSGFACPAQQACTAASAGPRTVLHRVPSAPVP